MTAFDQFPPTRPVPPPVPVVVPTPLPPVPVVPTPTPPPVTKDKAWVATIGGLLGTLLPYIADQSAHWPQPWPAVIALVIWGLTAFGVLQISNKPIAAPPPKE